MPSNFELRRVADSVLDDLQQRVKAELDRLADQQAQLQAKRLQVYGVRLAGRNGPGLLAVPVVKDAQRRIVREVRVGDALAVAVDMATGTDYLASFEPVVSRAGSLRQISTSNLSAVSIYFEFQRTA